MKDPAVTYYGELPGEGTKYAIIIPYAGVADLAACLQGLQDSMPEDRSQVHIHVVDDSKEPRWGQVYALNTGLLDCASVPFIVVMNDDVIVTDKNWLANMERVFEADPKVGVVACAVNHEGSALSASGLGAPKDDFVYRDIIPFYCTMISKECLDVVGVFDPSFIHGFGFDNDFCERVYRKGMRVAVDLRTVVEHSHRTTTNAVFGENAGDYQQRAERILYERYRGRIQ